MVPFFDNIFLRNFLPVMFMDFEKLTPYTRYSFGVVVIQHRSKNPN